LNFPSLIGWYRKILLDVLFENNYYQWRPRRDVTVGVKVLVFKGFWGFGE